jgi:hypothetical protein
VLPLLSTGRSSRLPLASGELVSATPDRQDSQRLLLTRREMNRIVALRYTAICLGLALFAVLGGVIGLAGQSAGAKALGAALIVAFLILSAVMYIRGRREVSREFPRLPVIEATPEELRLVEPSGETFRVSRHGLVSTARLTAPGIRGSRVLFRDAGGRTITHWDLDWIAPTGNALDRPGRIPHLAYHRASRAESCISRRRHRRPTHRKPPGIVVIVRHCCLLAVLCCSGVVTFFLGPLCQLGPSVRV